MSDIVFGSDESASAREELVWTYTSKIKDEIIGACKKCDNGFVPKKAPINSVSDLAYDTEIECECRKKANAISELVKSGIPTRFLKEQKIIFDPDAEKIFSLYTEKIDRVMIKGLGLTLYEAIGKRNPGITMAKSIALTLLVRAFIKAGRTAHYITKHDYAQLIRNVAVTKEEKEAAYLKEVNNVDLLCIDFIDSNMTAFVRSEFESILRNRMFQCKPTSISTIYTKEEFHSQMGEMIFEIVSEHSSCVQIHEFGGFKEVTSLRDL